MDDVGSPVPGDAYRLGDGLLELHCEDRSFRDRLRDTYAECRVPAGLGAPGPTVRCVVRRGGDGKVLVGFEDPAPLDTIGFALQLFADRGYRELEATSPGRRVLGDAQGRPLLETDGGPECVLDAGGPWQGLVGSLAVNRVLRLQQDVLFFHAASLVIGGAGLLVTGPKGTGKSTSALTLAARGHAFLGDEVAGVRVGSWDLLPMRRAVSIRTGPRSRAVDEALERHSGTAEVFPDGTRRVRAQARDLFPAAAARTARLRFIFFLGSFAERARIRPLTPGPADVRRLAPLGSTLWGVAPGRRLVDFLRLLSGVRSFLLDPGDPDPTAELIEATVESG